MEEENISKDTEVTDTVEDKEVPEISEKERERRRKISIYRKKQFEAKRQKGLRKYFRRRKREALKRKEKKLKEKEKERLRKEKEREKAKHKKKVGRPKKRGPKKKRKYISKKIVVKERKTRRLPPFIYKIISCRNGIQNDLIGKYRTSEEAFEVFENLKKEDENIVFPCMTSGRSALTPSIDEYVLIHKIDEDEDNTSVLRNEYGKLVEQKINIDGWAILDKCRYQKEETFWVWGYHNRKDRKTFLWIYANIILINISSKLDFKRLYVYRNKVLVKDDNNNIDMIICKAEIDATAFYNMVEKYCKKDKIKQILFIGDFSEGPKKKKVEEEIMALTGWNKKKTQMRTTTYYRKQ